MEEKREGREHFKQFNLASYAKKNFGMFGGEEVNVNVAISSQFFGWVFALGTGVKILAPENVVERMKQEIDALHDFITNNEGGVQGQHWKRLQKSVGSRSQPIRQHCNRPVRL